VTDCDVGLWTVDLDLDLDLNLALHGQYYVTAAIYYDTDARRTTDADVWIVVAFHQQPDTSLDAHDWLIDWNNCDCERTALVRTVAAMNFCHCQHATLDSHCAVAAVNPCYCNNYRHVII